MNIQVINRLNGQIKINKDKMKIEKDFKKRGILKLKTMIDELKIRMERLR